MVRKKIEILDQKTIDQIAAGEVVERPSSVVKELVENAIDAGAGAVTVEIAQGGKSLIRVTDNGAGIETEQIRTAFLSHATSKLQKLEDLDEIRSLGFRGEALSSIASVSQVEVITRTPSSLTGCRYVINGGVEESLEEIGAPEGTTFLVRNLFYNTPARSKFLKSDTAEASDVGTLMDQLSLAHPEVSFTFIHAGQVRLHTPGNGEAKDVIYQVFGREIVRELLPFLLENDFMKISGYIGKPGIARGNRAFEHYYVNGRYVRNAILTKAIEDGYHGFLMQHKFPFVLLQIAMDGREVDVNVHPRKLEVRFSRESEVYEAIREGIHKVLTGRELIPQVSPGPDGTFRGQGPAREFLPKKAVAEPFETRRLEQEKSKTAQRVGADALREEPSAYEAPKGEAQGADPQTVSPSPDPKPLSFRPDFEPLSPEGSGPVLTDKEEELFTGTLTEAGAEAKPEEEEMRQRNLFEEEKFLDPQSRLRHRLVGQIFSTYWLVEFGDRFFIIDQHAAHEKILYERLVKKFQEKDLTSQYLNPPLVVTLSLEEERRLLENEGLFRDFGFEWEDYGSRQYCIKALPAELYGYRKEEFFREMLSGLSLDRGNNPLSILAMRLATMACKAAVKGGDKMSQTEADRLIDELLKLEEPYHCPHGRPTIIEMSRTELEKKFHRIQS